jgi:hypothetical protein
MRNWFATFIIFGHYSSTMTDFSIDNRPPPAGGGGRLLTPNFYSSPPNSFYNCTKFSREVLLYLLYQKAMANFILFFSVSREARYQVECVFCKPNNILKTEMPNLASIPLLK